VLKLLSSIARFIIEPIIGKAVVFSLDLETFIKLIFQAFIDFRINWLNFAQKYKINNYTFFSNVDQPFSTDKNNTFDNS